MKKTQLISVCAISTQTTEENEESAVMKINLTYPQAERLKKKGYKVFESDSYHDGITFIHYHIMVSTKEFLQILPRI